MGGGREAMANDTHGVDVCKNRELSSLTTGPRFVETPAMTALGGYVTGTRGTSLCGAKTQQG